MKSHFCVAASQICEFVFGMSTIDRLAAVDLSDLSEAEMSALRQGAIILGVPFSEYLARLIGDASTRLVQRFSEADTPATGNSADEATSPENTPQ